MDESREYKPESQVVLDLESAYALFGHHPKETLSIARAGIQKLCADWNAENSTKVVSGYTRATRSPSCLLAIREPNYYKLLFFYRIIKIARITVPIWWCLPLKKLKF